MKYRIELNGGFYYGVNDKTKFDRKELVEEILKWNENTKMEDEKGNEITVDYLIDSGERFELYNDNMVERGDDCIDIRIVTRKK